MEQHETPFPSFRDACTLLSVREVFPVQQALQQEPTPYSPLELIYLRAWSACARASIPFTEENDAQWKAATGVLLTARETLLEANVAGANDYFSRAGGTIHRWRPWTCWLLGNLAFHLGVPTSEHYTQALRLLDQRRMNHPWLRIQVMCDQAQTLLRLLASRAALTRYEDALSLCEAAITRGERAHEAMPALYAGICEAAEQEGEEEAVLRYAPRALASCHDRERRAHLLILLGHVARSQGNHREARARYQEVLALTQDSTIRLSLWLILISLSLAERDNAAARKYSRQALEEAETQRGLLPTSQRDLYLCCGKIALAESETVEPPEAHRLVEESLSWHLRALAVSDDAHAVSELATLLEGLLRASNGHMSPSWMDAYRVLVQHLRYPEL